jgi:hypothetical protein
MARCGVGEHRNRWLVGNRELAHPWKVIKKLLKGTQMIDLAVAYRIYPRVSKSHAFFSADKFRLSKMCLDSFRGALGGLRVKVWALLDGCPLVS